ncbi:MAG: PTS sugar transporter subunit IIA [Planctomycetota bacterium]
MEDFDVDSLAAFLHTTPDQVRKLASRGKLPGRRIAGNWLFPREEMHHWLEQRIGVSDSEQLEKMEAQLSRRHAPIDGEVSIAALCRPENMAFPLSARTRTSVIRNMCDLAAVGGLLWDVPTMTNAVRQREELHPTALAGGVALLHPRRPQSSILAESLIALGITETPLPFSGDGQLTDIFFLICSYDDKSHLRILARLSRLVSDPQWLPALRDCKTPNDAHTLIRVGEDDLA